jgi:hypothetical protein
LQHKAGTSGKPHCSADRSGPMRAPILLAILLGAIPCACHRVPDEEAIRAAIAATAAAASARDGADVLGHVAEDFAGNDGEFDRDRLAAMLRVRLLAARSLSVRTGPVDVAVDGDRARATFDATFSDSSGRWIMDRRRTLHFVTGWRRSGGAWRCYNARWADAAP